LSQSSRQVTHVLLTRSRLCPRPKPGSSLHLHVLSTPPAFVLSQDQTLRESLAWFQSAGSRETPSTPVPLSDHGKLPSRGAPSYTEGTDLTGTDSGPSPDRRPCAKPRAVPVARRCRPPGKGFKPGRDRHSRSHVLLSFQRPLRPQGWGLHHAMKRDGPI
jgi:hypothetical protein